MRRVISSLRWCVVVACALPGAVRAQAFNYPSLQLPTASVRDYTAALSGGRGSAALFQWREQAGEGMQFGVDVGLANPKGNTTLLLMIGASGGREVLRATGDQPLDVMGTVGAGVVFGGGSVLLRIPVGASVGHTFVLEDGVSITPYVHPRISLDLCSACGAGAHRAASLNFDLGANVQVNPEFAVRAAGVFSGSDQFTGGNAFAVGVTWTPRALIRPAQARMAEPNKN